MLAELAEESGRELLLSVVGSEVEGFADSSLPVFLSLSSEDFDSDASSLATFRLRSFLKSVSYQPVPFNRKATGDTSFLSSGRSQAGQSTSGSSFIFWIVSKSWPQERH